MERSSVPSLVFATFLILAGAEALPAQFLPALLQNRSYWGDGKSEIDFYDADVTRDGQHFRNELLLILTPGFVDPATYAPVPRRPTECAPVIRMKQGITVPRGLLLEQRSVDAVWLMEPLKLGYISVAGTDGIGNICRTVRPKPAATPAAWTVNEEGYQGQTQHPAIPSPNGPFIFYDELPLRVRTVDFSKKQGEFDIQMAATILEKPGATYGFKPAKLSFQCGDRQIEVELRHENGNDHFILDANFPFLLREWKMANGDHWKMKNSLRADYAAYDKSGDRERALKDPMLRHPD